ncbi:MAG TPA: hypothetical protein VGH55_01630, partial [Chthoniobacterales bacterium]
TNRLRNRLQHELRQILTDGCLTCVSSRTACPNCPLLPWIWIVEKAEEIALVIPFVQTLRIHFIGPANMI